ncbi:hypothetical protein H6G97_22165 [Nostoc flagelliforme FACHB-838]|uniref:Uncharacterized protein n=1 Tax=Nostoc flagelliforme FACHB-838 TaxID=2692904 RepID=A0ABR8DUU2_9NOSO|nr:hypothetical protein [Nostoc flagelliforme]MBD2532138.1 hypothetical protein [Nostoc flagelliforme FACHB-838]
MKRRVGIQPYIVWYNIISRGVGARHCRAPTGVPHISEKRYSNFAIADKEKFD